MVGLALTIGLYPVGFLLPAAFTSAPFHLGPWLLPGLIPLGIGIALIVSYYLEQNGQPPEEEGNKGNVTPISEHMHKERRERP
jgi:hypothetical protein